MNIYICSSADEILEYSKKIVPSLAGIKACISNAERLFEDATKVSKPTSAALTELALEEISKAWWLMFKMAGSSDKKNKFIDKFMDDISQSPTLGKSGISLYDSTAETKRILQSISELVETTGDWKSLRDHNFKLKFMMELKLLIEDILPKYVRNFGPNEVQRLSKISGSKFETNNFSRKQITDQLKKMQNVLKGLNNTLFTSLDELKSEGFYVEYNEGEFFQPSDRTFEFSNLKQFVFFMITSLKRIILYYGS